MKCTAIWFYISHCTLYQYKYTIYRKALWKNTCTCIFGWTCRLRSSREMLQECFTTNSPAEQVIHAETYRSDQIPHFSSTASCNPKKHDIPASAKDLFSSRKSSYINREAKTSSFYWCNRLEFHSLNNLYRRTGSAVR